MADSSWPGEQLVVAARDGDVDALTALVSGAHPNVRRFARSLCASPEDAEDAAQEALIILYRKIGMLRASGAPASWMFRIVRNECLRRARAMRAPVALPEDARGSASSSYAPAFGAASASASTSASAEDEVLRRMEAAEVAAAIAALPADQRRVLIMRDVQGYSGRMAAEALGLSTAAMKSRLHRARAAVQRSLRPVSEPEPTPGGAHDDADRGRRP
ncbi:MULTISPECIES: RNA polymerase sigma factor [unclassified Streptomyces]|uniref:RNA polymerase sigma factor n=1 Tax=unclassified Streptomyces TaxID=2593676 RepID=UPI000DAE8440|nr:MULTISPECIES: RNA polymerase sigma factor [unclassified Streptomyces]PZT71935.1 RNA polymerase subunit sigma-24 [Streptomyces sp. AC1-42T]PZT81738.1 RNA polymerase subunit sigma-24 [Streptomyces sp. AC1-42W]